MGNGELALFLCEYEFWENINVTFRSYDQAGKEGRIEGKQEGEEIRKVKVDMGVWF